MVQKVIICKGLPASGKTTWAKELQSKEPGKWKRVNKDDLRAMLDNSKWTTKNENMVLKIRDDVILLALIEGFNVIVDDTNLNTTHEGRVHHIVSTHNKTLNKEVVVETKDFTNVPLEVCIERDTKRSHPVGEKVIQDMYDMYLATKVSPKQPELNPELPWAIIVDVDGTLAQNAGKRHVYDFVSAGGDVPNVPVVTTVKALQSGDKRVPIVVLVVSGREDQYRDVTETWLSQVADVPYNTLLMRKTGDRRHDDIVKEEIYHNEIEGKYNVLVVLDDRTRVVNMWRRMGLTCFQVAEGNF